ncbi:Triple functional domain protein [Manis javanica]|nr:Triple functional domain protein [Manis javanica]
MNRKSLQRRRVTFERGGSGSAGSSAPRRGTSGEDKTLKLLPQPRIPLDSACPSALPPATSWPLSPPAPLGAQGMV